MSKSELTTRGAGDGGEGVVGRGFCRFRLRGQIQGVGFRPFVYRLAHEMGIRGTVCNDPTGVSIEAWGDEGLFNEFERRLRDDAPALARVDDVVREVEVFGGNGVRAGENSGPSDFVIIESDHNPAERGRVTVDSAVCVDCLREMSDVGDRRYCHALINCTNCGPRYTIIRDLPYDRPLTTMASFAMCVDCRNEYDDPGDRRFHAQPTCCRKCGPRVALVDCDGNKVSFDGRRDGKFAEIDNDELNGPFLLSGELLRQGKILAMKGLGGYHLVVDATNGDAVARLRRLKKRDAKPFAIMVSDIEEAKRLCDLSEGAVRLMSSPVSPIVIACVRDDKDADDGGDANSLLIAKEVAPGQDRLGVMVPYTPMQHLLMREIGRPVVMTSANLSDDPLIIEDEEARTKLRGIADYFLLHDRAIERAVDDSIYLDGGAKVGLIPLRRARGLVPAPVSIPVGVPNPGLCLGADLKNVVAIVRGSDAVVSQHIGDLSYALAYERFVRTIDDLARLFDITPSWVAVDLHPRYLSRRFGLRMVRQQENEGGLSLVEVQHHHAHLASVMAEYGRTESTIGLICDGVGYGTDGTAWGGEILVGDLLGFERVGHLRAMRLPGGDVSAKKTGRCAVSWMVDALGLSEAAHHALTERILNNEKERSIVLAMLDRDMNCPLSTGAGRLFDGVAAVLGVCDFNQYEAQSGQLLESCAMRSTGKPSGAGLMPIVDGVGEGMFEIDTRPMVCSLLGEMEVKRGKLAGDGDTAAMVDDLSWMFHDGFAEGLVRSAERARERTGVGVVGLSGGVFCNALLLNLVKDGLENKGFEVLIHREFPPNDGGIAYGQAAVAGARLGLV